MSDDRGPAAGYVAATTVAVGALAGVLAQMTVFVPLDRAASTVEARLGATLVVVLGLAAGLALLAALTIVPLYAALSDRAGGRIVRWVTCGSLAVVVCLGVGFVGIQPVATGFADAHVDTYGGYGGPHADFEVSVDWVGDDRGVVTFTHAGGDPLHAEHVYVRGEGFAEADGADHVGPGVWQGTVSGERPRRGGPAVVDGDSVSVGVKGNCTVVIAYEGDGRRGTMAGYECPEFRTVA